MTDWKRVAIQFVALQDRARNRSADSNGAPPASFWLLRQEDTDRWFFQHALLRACYDLGNMLACYMTPKHICTVSPFLRDSSRKYRPHTVSKGVHSKAHNRVMRFYPPGGRWQHRSQCKCDGSISSLPKHTFPHKHKVYLFFLRDRVLLNQIMHTGWTDREY